MLTGDPHKTHQSGSFCFYSNIETKQRKAKRFLKVVIEAKRKKSNSCVLSAVCGGGGLIPYVYKSIFSFELMESTDCLVIFASLIDVFFSYKTGGRKTL